MCFVFFWEFCPLWGKLLKIAGIDQQYKGHIWAENSRWFIPIIPKILHKCVIGRPKMGKKLAQFCQQCAKNEECKIKMIFYSSLRYRACWRAFKMPQINGAKPQWSKVADSAELFMKSTMQSSYRHFCFGMVSISIQLYKSQPTDNDGGRKHCDLF